MEAPPIPKRWQDVAPALMNAVIALHHRDAIVREVTLLERDDDTNRRARFGLTYAAGSGPATVFAKAESDVAGRREIHARNGNLFDEPLRALVSIGITRHHLSIRRPVIFDRGT